MARLRIYPDGDDGGTGVSASGGGAFYSAINEVYNATNHLTYVTTSDFTINCQMRVTLGPVSTLLPATVLINSVTMNLWMAWDPPGTSGIPDPGTWPRTWAPAFWFSGTPYDGTSRAAGAVISYPSFQTHAWALSPVTAARWTPTELDGAIAGWRTTDAGGFPRDPLWNTQLWVDVDYDPLPGEHDRVRDVLTRRLRAYRKGRKFLTIVVPVWDVNLDLGSEARIAHSLAPVAAASGWPVDDPRLFRLVKVREMPTSMSVELTFQDLRWNVGVFTLWDIGRSVLSASHYGEGIGVASPGGARTLTRNSLAYVEDPGAHNAGGIRVVQVERNYEKHDRRGRLHEEARTNYFKDSCFVSGSLAGWGSSAGDTAIMNDEAVWDTQLTANHVRVKANGAVAGSLVSAAGQCDALPSAPIAASFTYRNVSGTLLARLKRSTDGFYFNPGTGLWQAGAANIASLSGSTTATRFRYVFTPGASYQLLWEFLTNTATATDEARIFDLQLESGPYATSRMLTNGAAFVRAADVFSDAQPAGQEAWPNDGGTFACRVMTWWNSADLPAGAVRVVEIVYYSATHYVLVRYSQASGAWEFIRRVGATTYTASLIASVTRDTEIKLAARWVPAGGASGLAAHTQSVFVAGVKGTDVVGAVPTFVAGTPVYWGSERGLSNWFDGAIYDVQLTHEVLTDAEIARL